MFKRSQLFTHGLLWGTLLANLHAQDIEALMKGTGAQGPQAKPNSKPPAPAKLKKILPSSNVATIGKAFTWNGAQLPVYRSSFSASSAVDAALASTQSLLKQAQELINNTYKLQDELAKARKEFEDLAAGKEAYMAEIRGGLFCSGCGRTKSDIVSKGERFPHSGQHIVPPTPEQIAKFENDYDAKIASARMKFEGKDKSVKANQQNLDDAAKRLAQQLALVIDGLRQEAPLILTAFQAEKCSNENSIAQWKTLLDATKGEEERERLRSNISKAKDKIESQSTAYHQKRAKLWEQLGRCNSYHAEASRLVGPAAIPARWYGTDVESMPSAIHVPCK